MERCLLIKLGFENLICVTVCEFIKTFFYDFRYNNLNFILEMNLERLVNDFEAASLLFARLVMHYECFYKYGYDDLTYLVFH
jgi:hypothetical protein